MGITPGNNPGTERELLPRMEENSSELPYMVLGNPTGHGIQFQGMEYCFNYLCQRSELVLQSIRPSDLYEQFGFSLYLNRASNTAIPNRNCDDVKISNCL